MLIPMFLLRGQDDSLDIQAHFLTINYYLDGQFIGGGSYELDPDTPMPLILRPRGSHYITAGAIVRYSNFAYPIPGFEDGWRDENGIAYTGTDTSTGNWAGVTFFEKPLGQKKGMIEMNTQSVGYRGCGIDLGPNAAFDSVFTNNRLAVYNQYLGSASHPAIKSVPARMSIPTLETGQYIGVTAEFA